jgi:hypothetical protein
MLPSWRGNPHELRRILRRIPMNRKLSIVLALMVMPLLVAPVSAGRVTQISGIGEWATVQQCDPKGQGADYALKLTGDLDGCFYGFVEDFECKPSGIYIETGRNLYVDGEGTFEATYRFIAKYEDCPNLTGEVFGRCQHPIVAGSGTGVFDGVTGRLAFRDDLVADNIPYRGHLK